MSVCRSNLLPKTAETGAYLKIRGRNRFVARFLHHKDNHKNSKCKKKFLKLLKIIAKT